MKNVLIINGHQKAGESKGELTTTHIKEAKKFLTNNDYNIKSSIIEDGYTVQEELDKFVWADYIILQYPVFWMGVPWITKKYIDDIFSGGYATVTCSSDGRSRSDASKRYGSGGLMTQKKYMLSVTYNCPNTEFNNKDGFFEGMSVDEAHVATHKTFQFCGVKPMETYAIYDVHKDELNIEEELNNFKAVLKRNFV